MPARPAAKYQLENCSQVCAWPDDSEKMKQLYLCDKRDTYHV